MRLLILTHAPRSPDLSAMQARLLQLMPGDRHVLDKEQARNLKAFLRGINLTAYDRILVDLPFKHIRTQAALLARLPGVLIYEEDACQNYLASSKWQGAFSRFYRQLPGARIVVTGCSVARRLREEGFDVSFMAKGYDGAMLYDEGRERDIELGFIGRTASNAYQGRKELLDSLQACEPLQLLRTEPGADYRQMLNRIRFFISADVGLGEYMAKNFEAMACGCVLLAWRQGEEEPAIGLQDGEHLLLYASLDELRTHLTALRADPARATRIAHAGREFVAAHCTHDSLAERLAAELAREWPPLPAAPAGGWLAGLRSLFKSGKA
jgi:hypothetical protein